MKILVTGGSGFLGSHVVDALVKRGHEVTIFDLHRSKYAPIGVIQKIGDIVNRKNVHEALAGIDVVYHFSGISGIEDCKNNPRKAFEINVNGTLNILEACVKNGVQKLIFASSAYVFSRYGYIYRTTKICCENLIKDYHYLFNINFVNLRFGSLYGRRTDERNSIYRMLKSALIDGEIVYHGTGAELREYIHVHDAAEIASDILDDKYLNRDIIITGNEKFKYEEILNFIQEILGKKIKIIMMEKNDNCHYTLTPYNYNSGPCQKLTKNEYIDFGQGILDILEYIKDENSI